MQWLNEPAQWSEQAGSLVVTVGDAVEVRYCVDHGEWRLAALAYLPPRGPVLAGAMCAAPEGSGFQVTFHDLKVTQLA